LVKEKDRQDFTTSIDTFDESRVVKGTQILTKPKDGARWHEVEVRG